VVDDDEDRTQPRRGEDEERYLFAALCAAAPAVTLSWPTLSDDGKERGQT